LSPLVADAPEEARGANRQLQLDAAVSKDAGFAPDRVEQLAGLVQRVVEALDVTRARPSKMRSYTARIAVQPRVIPPNGHGVHEARTCEGGELGSRRKSRAHGTRSN